MKSEDVKLNWIADGKTKQEIKKSIVIGTYDETCEVHRKVPFSFYGLDPEKDLHEEMTEAAFDHMRYFFPQEATIRFASEKDAEFINSEAEKYIKEN